MKKIIQVIIFVALLCSTIGISTTIVSAASKYDLATSKKSIKVYSKAGKSYKVLGKLKKGSTVKIYDGIDAAIDQPKAAPTQQIGFSKIKYKGKTGYVVTTDLKFKNPKNWVPHVKERVIKSIKKNSLQGESYRIVYDTDVWYVLQIKENGKWRNYININCKTGWYRG